MFENWEDVLKQYEGTGELLEFYTGTDEDGFSIGTVVQVFDDIEDDEDDVYADASVIIGAIDPDGGSDGLLWLPLYDLTRVCAGTQFLQSKKALVGEEVLQPFETDEETGLDALFELSHQEGRILSVDIGVDEPVIFGVVEDYNDVFVQMHCYTEEGADDGVSFIDREQIDFCQYQGVDERAVERLAGL